MTVSFVSVYFWATFPAGAKAATLFGPIRLQPAPVATPAVGHYHTVTEHTVTSLAHRHRHGANCVWIWRQNCYYAIPDDSYLPHPLSSPSSISLLAATLTPDLCCFPPGLCSWGLQWTWISVTTAKLSPSGSTEWADCHAATACRWARLPPLEPGVSYVPELLVPLVV